MFHLCGCDNYFEVKIWFVLFFPSVIAITELIEKKNRISVKYFDTFVFFFFFDFSFFWTLVKYSFAQILGIFSIAISKRSVAVLFL